MNIISILNEIRTRTWSVLCRPKFVQLAGLSILRICAALGSLLSTIVIVRLFPMQDSGKFFVFIAMTQLVVGSMLGPLLLLSIRFGSIHKESDDHAAIGRLIVFGLIVIFVVTVFAAVAHPLVSLSTNLDLGATINFILVIGLGGFIALLGGLARVNGRVINAILPENLIRPLGLALAAIGLWQLAETTFPALSAAYVLVLIVVCGTLATMGPWSLVSFNDIQLSRIFVYSKSYWALLGHGIVITALSTIDLILVSYIVSIEAVPAYKAATQYALLLATGVIFSNLIYGPKIAVAYKKGDLDSLRRLARASSRLSLAFFVIAFLPLLSGPWMFEIAFGDVGREAWELAVILCVGRFASAWFGSVTSLATLTGHTVVLMLMQLVSVFILLLLGPVLGESFSSKGLALASAIAMTVWVIATSFALRKRLVVRLGPK